MDKNNKLSVGDLMKKHKQLSELLDFLKIVSHNLGKIVYFGNDLCEDVLADVVIVDDEKTFYGVEVGAENKIMLQKYFNEVNEDDDIRLIASYFVSSGKTMELSKIYFDKCMTNIYVLEKNKKQISDRLDAKHDIMHEFLIETLNIKYCLYDRETALKTHLPEEYSDYYTWKEATITFSDTNETYRGNIMVALVNYDNKKRELEEKIKDNNKGMSQAEIIRKMYLDRKHKELEPICKKYDDDINYRKTKKEKDVKQLEEVQKHLDRDEKYTIKIRPKYTFHTTYGYCIFTSPQLSKDDLEQGEIPTIVFPTTQIVKTEAIMSYLISDDLTVGDYDDDLSDFPERSYCIEIIGM